jgi:hypothetical protein
MFKGQGIIWDKDLFIYFTFKDKSSNLENIQIVCSLAEASMDIEPHF